MSDGLGFCASIAVIFDEIFKIITLQYGHISDKIMYCVLEC